MSKTNARKVKKGKFKMLLFFLFVTFFIWFLTKFSKEFTATVDASIDYINIPNSTVLASNNIDEISFDLTSSGFDFLLYKFKKPTITINLAVFYKEEQQSISISNNKLIKIITSELNSNIAVKNVSVNELNVMLDRIVSKKVPIKIDSDITFQSGFEAVEELSVNPNFIIVSGPSVIIDSLKEVKTKPIALALLSSATTGDIELENLENLNLTFSEKIVSYSIVVEEFTQKELSIPIIIKNLPIGLNIKLIPEVISVVFDVSVTKFNAVSENDFIVICDYNKRDSDENFIMLEISKKPVIIQNVFLKKDKIEYLIFK